MFSKLAEFFIKNTKLSIVFVLTVLITGIGSYILIPKQYNPKIVLPAYSIFIEANGLNANDVKKYITDELENKIMEIEGIDETFGVSNENYSALMVKFKVGQDLEKSKIKLIQKINENMNLKPYGVGTPIIKSINPDDLPQITFAINYKPNGDQKLDEQKTYIYLRQIANIIKSELKTIDGITTIDIVGGLKNNLVIDLDINKIESKNLDLLGVYEKIKKNNINYSNGNIVLENNQKIFLQTNGKLNNIEELSKLNIGDDKNIIYLKDIANIYFGAKRLDYYSTYADKNYGSNTVLLGFGKQPQENSVKITKKIKEEINKLKLPKDIEIKIIQDEGQEAGLATNLLIKDLIESIIIVVFILIVFLGLKNALNTATSIPLILSLVFLYSYVVGYDINRISLFALILVIGMLVDDSIVVVENIHRHLEERFEKGKTKLEAILEATSEVGPGVILSTITKILSFVGMFFVTGMMGEYMGPIPKFAIVALVLSIFIAFTINPWIAYLTTKEGENHKKVEKKSKYDIRIFYLKIMEKFIRNDKSGAKNRKIFKLAFWISLVLVIVLPIYGGIFKARMLPKSDKDQVYLWIDGPRGADVKTMLEINKDVEMFFVGGKTPIPNPFPFKEKGEKNNNSSPSISLSQEREDKKLPSPSGEGLGMRTGEQLEVRTGEQLEVRTENLKINTNLQIATSVTSTIGTAFISDFANLFRGGNNRNGEFQISSRINLKPAHLDKNRIKSEDYVIQIRPILRDYLLSKYPDIKLRLLEDPPGPPVRATFMMKLKSKNNDLGLENFSEDVYKIVKNIQTKYDIVDIGTSKSTTYKKIDIKLDHQNIIKNNLTVEQVINGLNIYKNNTVLNLITDSNSFEETNIMLSVQNKFSEDIESIKNLKFTNPKGEKIPLYSLAKINYSFVGDEINTDKREKSNFIYGEMGNNSVIYPIINLYSSLKNLENYKYIDSDFYKITFEGKVDKKTYVIEWDGEWKLTMDTFRDLGTAMIIAILTIYFLLVGQFKSFRIAGIIMLPFLLGFYGIFPGFSLMYLLKNEYFNATSMIGVISLAGIVVGNAILLIDYVDILIKKGVSLEKALLSAGLVRFMPIMLTSISAIFGAIKITSDPVWSGLAWSIVFGLSSSAILTLIAIPIFYYDSQKKRV